MWIKLRRAPWHPGYFIADTVADQRRLSTIGWGSKAIRECDLDALLSDAGKSGYGLETIEE